MFARNGSWMAIAATLCLFAGFGFSLIGVDQLHEALHSSAKPVPIPCSQLRSYRPGSNLHITLTQFVPYQKGILIYEGAQGRSWSVWVPILPADAPKADPSHIVAVVQLSGISDEAALRRALDQSRWTGMIHSQGEFGSYAAHLCQFNPGINLGKCWVIWQGHQPADLSSALIKMIACPCLFVLGMILAVLAALQPITAPGKGSMAPVGLQSVFAPALGEAVRWLYRRGFFNGYTAVFLAALGLAAVGAGGYVVCRDWDQVVKVTGEMHLAIIGGLIGLGLLAYAVLLGNANRRTAPEAPAPAPYQRVQGATLPEDPRQMAWGVVGLGVFLLSIAGTQIYRQWISPWTFVFASLGGLALVGGVVWYGRLGWKKRQEPARFWSEPESQ